MSHRARQLKVSSLARVEGEGALYVIVRDGQVERADLQIYEPPRFFEALLRGRGYTEPPDITARICGICPVAYQTSACNAIEDACGVRVGGPIREVRRLLYCGEWISSHALHIYLLHAPDFLGYPDAIALAADHREIVERGLMLKKAGNAILELVGGRAIHPINVRVGGFYAAPSRAQLDRLAEQLRPALDAAVATVRWVAGFGFPDVELDHELLAVYDPARYAIEGRTTLRRSAGPSFEVDTFSNHVVEEHVPHSTALHASLDGGLYLTGPLARYTLNHEQLTPLALELAAEVGLGNECRNPFRSIVVRAIETVYAVEEALRLIESYEPPEPPYVAV
ncbi:MAG TPA: nickel-dependent hydrogenase large subunit, partial [Kribbella sp.]|nr:nickel-dependent hydrogenase large subunit [Kribbella sp.]